MIFSFARRNLVLPGLGFCFLLSLNAGCGSSGVEPVPVEGTVKIGDKPVEKGSIAFHPDTAKGNTLPQSASGTIENGKFSLGYMGKEGAPPGAYKVTVVVTVPSNPKDEYSEPKSLIANEFSIPEATPLTAEVKEGGGPYDFKVTK